jgi:hypothetical protein
MNCPNFTKCQTELTQMKNKDGDLTCLRCLKCHPLPKELADDQKKVIENKKVDVPWTAENIWEAIEPKVRLLFADLIEDYVIAQNRQGADEESIMDVVAEKTWQEQAKDLGINPYGRKKEIVLAEMAEKTKRPEEPVDNESL